MLELLRAINTGRRADSRRTFDAIVVTLVRHADWATGAITTSHETIAREAGALCGRGPFSHDTVARVVAAAAAAGVLVCPQGLGGMSRRALRSARNQCPTYFVIDPDAAPAASPDADLRTPQPHDSEAVALRDTHALYKGPIFPKFRNFDPGRVPTTPAQRQAAAEWLRCELHVGAIPNWAMTAMTARHFAAGLSPRQVFRRVCVSPDGAENGTLPVGERVRDAVARSRHSDAARMLLAMIGGRLKLWAGVPVPVPAGPPAQCRPVPVPAGPAARTAPKSAEALAALARIGLRAGALR